MIRRLKEVVPELKVARLINASGPVSAALAII